MSPEKTINYLFKRFAKPRGLLEQLLPSFVTKTQDSKLSRTTRFRYWRTQNWPRCLVRMPKYNVCMTRCTIPRPQISVRRAVPHSFSCYHFNFWLPSWRMPHLRYQLICKCHVTPLPPWGYVFWRLVRFCICVQWNVKQLKLDTKSILIERGSWHPLFSLLIS